MWRWERAAAHGEEDRLRGWYGYASCCRLVSLGGMQEGGHLRLTHGESTLASLKICSRLWRRDLSACVIRVDNSNDKGHITTGR